MMSKDFPIEMMPPTPLNPEMLDNPRDPEASVEKEFSTELVLLVLVPPVPVVVTPSWSGPCPSWCRCRWSWPLAGTWAGIEID